MKRLIFAMILLASASSASGEGAPRRPYDDKLARLSEILGAVHFLRELCGANEGQLWRDQMQGVLEADGGDIDRRLRFVNSFNSGYRSFRRTYQNCTSEAIDQTKRFLSEAADLAKTISEMKP